MANATCTITKIGRHDEFGRPLTVGQSYTGDSNFVSTLVQAGFATLVFGETIEPVPRGGLAVSPADALTTPQANSLSTNNGARMGAIAAAARSVDPSRAFQVMSAPPTIVYANTALAAITPLIRYSVGYQDNTLPNSVGSSSYSHFRLLCAGKLIAGAFTTPRFEFLRPSWRTRNTAPPACDNCCHSYVTDSRYFELEIINYSGLFSLYIKVNDQYVSLTPQVYSAPVGVDGKAFYSMDFGAGSVGVEKRIDVISINCFIGAARVQAPYGCKPAPVRGPRAFLVADSWGQDYSADTSGAAPGPFTLTRVMQELLGWDDFWNDGSGSTGYLAGPAVNEYTFRQRVISDVIPYKPELVVFLGSLNDDSSGYAALYAEALLTYRTLQAAVQSCIIIVMPTQVTQGPGFSNSSKATNRAAIRQAATDAGVLYFDPSSFDLDVTNTPYSTTLAAGVSNSSTFTTNGLLQPHATYAFGDGTRIECITSSGYGPNNCTSDAAFTQANGARLTLIGNAFMTGNGRVGAAGSVTGTADVYMNSDATPHLSPVGVGAYARLMAGGIVQVLKSAALRA